MQVSTFSQVSESVDHRFQTFAGAVLAAAIADAMGWVTEFARGQKDLENKYGRSIIDGFISWEKQTGGRFYPYIDFISAGEYSDDTQLSLATARSLLPNGQIDMDFFSKHELVSWLDYARGAGRTVTAASRALTRKGVRWNTNFFTLAGRTGSQDYTDAGANGVAMRIAPCVLANIDNRDSMVQAILEKWHFNSWSSASVAGRPALRRGSTEPCSAEYRANGCIGLSKRVTAIH